MLWLLITGRGAFRATSQLAMLLLIPVWGSADFAQYANAVGVCAWMVYLSAGAEKAALKLVPRSRRVTGELVRGVLLLSAAPLALALVGMLVAPSHSSARLYLAAASWNIVNGLLMLVAGLQRLHNRARNDAAIYLTMTLAVVGTVGLAWWLDLDPVPVLVILTLIATALAVGFTVTLPRAWLLHRSGRRVGRVVMRNVGLLGVVDLLAALSSAGCYAALALAGRTAESGGLYLALMVCSAFGTLLGFLLRFAQPRLSVRQRGAGSVRGRAQAVSYLRSSMIGGVVVAVALPVAMLLGTPPTVALVALAIVEIPLYAVVTYASWLLENTDGRALWLTSTSAGVGLATCVALCLVLVPAWGAAGALGALILSFAARGEVLRRAVLRRYRAEQPVPVAATPG